MGAPLSSNSGELVYEALDPVADSGAHLDLLAPRLPDLAGETIALVDNTKEFARAFMDILKERLQARFPDTKLNRYEKLAAASLDSALQKKIVQECQAVVQGIGD